MQDCASCQAPKIGFSSYESPFSELEDPKSPQARDVAKRFRGLRVLGVSRFRDLGVLGLGVLSLGISGSDIQAQNCRPSSFDSVVFEQH